MRAGTAMGARLVEVSHIGIAGKNHVASTVGDAIVQVCGNKVKKLVHVMGGELVGHDLLGTNGTEVDKDFFFNRASVPQEGANDALDALDTSIVKRRSGIRLHVVLSLGTITYGGMLLWRELGL